MKMPGFTAAESLYITRNHYRVLTTWTGNPGEQNIMSKEHCKPICYKCVEGVQECVTWDCQPYSQSCECTPDCFSCDSNPSKGPGGWQLCTRENCTKYWQQCQCTPVCSHRAFEVLGRPGLWYYCLPNEQCNQDYYSYKPGPGCTECQRGFVTCCDESHSSCTEQPCYWCNTGCYPCWIGDQKVANGGFACDAVPTHVLGYRRDSSENIL